jgi:hypothetical protein
MRSRSTFRLGRWLRLGAVLGVGLFSQAALAQFEPRISGRPGEEHIRSSVGVSIQGGGGVTDFTSSGGRAATNVGGSWDVRAVVGTRRILALEGAYVGSARALSTGSFLANNMDLIGNGLEGNVRLNAPFLAGETLIEPFGFVGIGWTNYYLTNPDITLVSTGDNVGTVPMGAGLAIGYRGFIAEARFTYRPVFDDNQMILATGDTVTDLDNWNVGLMLGFEF